jgi:hypothetical protein
MNEQIKLLDTQISGKNAKFIDQTGLQIYKKLSSTEYTFYQYINSLQIH